MWPGEIVASATDAPDLAVGTRVMLQPGISCGRCIACLSGRDNECPVYEALGYRNHPGGYAEYVTVPVQNVDSRFPTRSTSSARPRFR